MSPPSWFDDAKQVGTEAVAEGLGLPIASKHGARGFTCPHCNKDLDDGRPSGRLVHGGRGWKCWRCDKGGDGLRLAAVILIGVEDAGTRWAEVRAWYASKGWCDPDPRADSGIAPMERMPPPALPPEPPPERLPSKEVARLWASAWPVFTESRAHRWCMARGLESWRVAGLDLARSLPPGAACPDWAWMSGAAWSDGLTLLLPCYGVDGRLMGVRARWTGTEHADEGEPWREVEAPDRRKEVSPRGAGALRGTLYADPVGRWLLGAGSDAKRGDQPDPDAPALRWDGRIMIVEGGPTWLRFASADGRVKMIGDVGWTPAVFGVWSGAWPDGEAGGALAARMAGAEAAVIATDDDKAGDRYARVISSALHAVGVAVHRANKGNGS